MKQLLKITWPAVSLRRRDLGVDPTSVFQPIHRTVNADGSRALPVVGQAAQCERHRQVSCGFVVDVECVDTNFGNRPAR